MQKTNEKKFVVWFEEIGMEDRMLVGGKNAALGEMYSALRPLGVVVPNGFAVTTHAYHHFLQRAGLRRAITQELKGLDPRKINDLRKRGQTIRDLIGEAKLPQDLIEEIKKAYRILGKNTNVAVRSSAVAEDLSDASFAGQQDTYLNVVGEKAVLKAIKKTIASLFCDRAISYRHNRGFSELGDIAVGVQQMVRADRGVSGVTFTLDPETGFDKVVVINSSYGLGELVGQGAVTPDEFVVFKPLLEQGKGIIEKTLGPKKAKLVYGKDTLRGDRIRKVPVSQKDQGQFCLQDEEIIQLAQWAVAIEKHFGKPLDIEWAKDGISGEFFILQARPETAHGSARESVWREYRLKEKGVVLVKGMAVGMKIASGPIRIIRDIREMDTFQKGEVLVASLTDPDWEPVMKEAAALVTDKGGRTSHAAIIAREFGIPAVVGTGNATTKLKSGQRVTVDCSSASQGRVYRGELKFEMKARRTEKIPETQTKIMVNIGAPDEAFKNAWLPVKGVGLGRIEFIIASSLGIHPNALIDYRRIKTTVKKQIDELTKGYRDKKQFYIDKLAEGIAKIGAAFWPHEVIIRFSDFKTNEYRKLIGGELYEPIEQNPMLGWRGAARYCDPRFQEAFGLECAAIKKVREHMGLWNVTPMVPFCRTPEEARKVLAFMEQEGLQKRNDSQLRIYVMCEIPSNVVLADEFLDLFDGMSIGSNDLTQLTLGIDRDSDIGKAVGDENHRAVRELVASIVKKCRQRGKYVGICGQAPSDYPEFTQFLIEQDIESISLNPDAVISTILQVAELEKRTVANRIT